MMFVPGARFLSYDRLHVERERHPHAGARPADTALYRI